jgi:hypothetical protein
MPLSITDFAGICGKLTGGDTHPLRRFLKKVDCILFLKKKQSISKTIMGFEYAWVHFKYKCE